MILLITGLLLFFLPHSLNMLAPRFKPAVVAVIGEWSYKGLYALISIIGLALVIEGYAAARLEPVILYQSPVWLRHLAALLLLPTFILVFAAYIPGKIQAKLPHPMLLATKLWATAHLLVNGSLADIILFGSFLLWAVTLRINLKKREQKIPMLPFGKWGDAIVIVLGLIAYGVFAMVLHRILIGVSPIA